MAKSNPFGKFVTKSKKVEIAALGATVEVREPTISEVASFFKSLTDAEGKFVQANFLDAKIQRVADCMIEPSMSFDELKSLSATAGDALGEIYEAIEALIEKPEVTEGN